ncbi:hypothetical protein [Leifsonia virtsii]|uniref:Integral membrane protein n=1 Tax=Leifsonia virtsii TaxID=3035915 RepID=A0ABT8J1Q6_9MICO|nr:hypothetical protein [Leifsonia virtsii]MDN4598990.1 hypothetical protein [Leifsonia virtsii]
MTAGAPVRPPARRLRVADGRALPAPTSRPTSHGLLMTLAHELPAVGLMLAACVTGGGAALFGGALALALLAMLYARSARRSAFAREHIVDLWAMQVLLVAMAFGEAGVASASPAGHHHGAALASGPVAVALTVVALAGWTLGRVLLARRVLRAHTVISATLCGGMLAAMALLP